MYVCVCVCVCALTFAVFLAPIALSITLFSSTKETFFLSLAFFFFFCCFFALVRLLIGGAHFGVAESSMNSWSSCVRTVDPKAAVLDTGVVYRTCVCKHV